MKNIIKGIVSVAIVLLMVWGIWSWWDGASSNTPTSTKELSKYNFFALLTKEEEPTREAVATIYCTEDNLVVFNTVDDGMLWEMRVADTNGWNATEYYTITFDTNNSIDVKDDRIISVEWLQTIKDYDRGQ